MRKEIMQALQQEYEQQRLKIRRRKYGGGRRLSPAARRLGSTSPSGRT